MSQDKEDEEVQMSVEVDEERLAKLSHLWGAKRRSVGEALTPLRVQGPQVTNMKKSMSVEKILALKGNFDTNAKKARSLPRKIDFAAEKERQLEESALVPEESKTPPPLPEQALGDSVVTARIRSDTIGTTGEAASKKANRGSGNLSSKKAGLPAINLSMLQKEEDLARFNSQLESSKSLDLATPASGGKKKLPPVSTSKEAEYSSKDRGNFTTGSDRGQATIIPVIFRDMALVPTQIAAPPQQEKPPVSPKVERALNLRDSKEFKDSKESKDKTNGKLATAKGTIGSKSPAVSKAKPKSGATQPNTTPRKLSDSSSRKPTTPRSTIAIAKKTPRVFSPTSMLRSKQGLSPHEQKEVLEYSEVFYTGEPGAKIMVSSKTAPNKGYDDEKGDYKIILKDHVAYRYEIIGLLGSGAFGQVAKVHDHKTGKNLALKIIRNRKRYHDQALIEHKILAYVKQKDPHGQANIVNMVDFFYFRNHICFTFDLLSINLYDFIKANHFRGSSEKLIRKFAVKLLQSMKFLAKHHIIHCDLKPENVLLNDLSKSDITLIDFGSSCFEHEKIFTYIQSRFYRAPEIILGIPYGISIDMWSFGCILAELFTGYPLFPGENELDQLSCIMEIMGVPPEDLLKDATRKKYFFASNGKPRIIENSQGIKRFPGTKTLQDFLPNSDPLLISFIADCIKWFPKDRLTPSTALQHPWVLVDGPIESFNNDMIE